MTDGASWLYGSMHVGTSNESSLPTCCQQDRYYHTICVEHPNKGDLRLAFGMEKGKLVSPSTEIYIALVLGTNGVPGRDQRNGGNEGEL